MPLPNRDWVLHSALAFSPSAGAKRPRCFFNVSKERLSALRCFVSSSLANMVVRKDDCVVDDFGTFESGFVP